MRNYLYEMWIKLTMTAGLFTGVVGGLALSEFLAIGGFGLALASLVANIWHKRQMVKIELEKLEIERRRPNV